MNIYMQSNKRILALLIEEKDYYISILSLIGFV